MMSKNKYESRTATNDKKVKTKNEMTTKWRPKMKWTWNDTKTTKTSSEALPSKVPKLGVFDFWYAQWRVTKGSLTNYVVKAKNFLFAQY